MGIFSGHIQFHYSTDEKNPQCFRGDFYAPKAAMCVKTARLCSEYQKSTVKNCTNTEKKVVLSEEMCYD
jgi:hypothetical protein